MRFWLHYVLVDCLMMDAEGNSYMVDVLGRRWKRDKESGLRVYRYCSTDYFPLGLRRVRKQNKKVIKFSTFGSEGMTVEKEIVAVGVTMSFEQARQSIMNHRINKYKTTELAEDSDMAIIEAMLGD